MEYSWKCADIFLPGYVATQKKRCDPCTHFTRNIIFMGDWRTGQWWSGRAEGTVTERWGRRRVNSGIRNIDAYSEDGKSLVSHIKRHNTTTNGDDTLRNQCAVLWIFKLFGYPGYFKRWPGWFLNLDLRRNSGHDLRYCKSLVAIYRAWFGPDPLSLWDVYLSSFNLFPLICKRQLRLELDGCTKKDAITRCQSDWLSCSCLENEERAIRLLTFQENWAFRCRSCSSKQKEMQDSTEVPLGTQNFYLNNFSI